MKPSRLLAARKILSAVIFLSLAAFAACSRKTAESPIISQTQTFAGFSADQNKRFGEPFGVAFDRNNVLYVSDGERGIIWRVSGDEQMEIVADRLDTPSGIAFDGENFLIVADAGSHTVKRINIENGEVALIAGIENSSGYADGAAAQSLFNAPVGVAVSDRKIYVADTYNDKIRVIENGAVATLAGGAQGYADGLPAQAEFDTPTGVAVLADGSLAIADFGNRRIRRVELSGTVSTLAGGGEQDAIDGFPLEAEFVQPTALTVDQNGALYIADGNSLRVLGGGFVPFVRTISDTERGYADGAPRAARFNRPSGLAFDQKGDLFVADAENRTIRILTGAARGTRATAENIEKLNYTAEEFRALQPARWTYDPPQNRRDIAGTLGEIRGEIANGKQAWFHNGLDVAGNFGETARFIRTEKVLHPQAAEGFGNLRERLRLPTVGYIHIRLGRDSGEKTYNDRRFQFARDANGKLNAVRVPRGARFQAGEPIGTLNAFNHVHLVAGRAGNEMNALDALKFPNIADTRAPVIEKVSIYEENWTPVETLKPNERIKLRGKTRVVVRAYDQMDGNRANRRLGVYRLGFQLLRADETPVGAIKWTISFARMPDENLVSLVYAPGSKSGYTPETIFDYIVTNEINDAAGRENFFDAAELEAGDYILRAQAADFFGNESIKDTKIQIVK